MVIMTAKLSKGKLIAALLILVAVVVMTIVLCSGQQPESGTADTANAATNDDRIAYLSTFGWTVNGDPVQTQQIRIPEQSSEVFDRYNELQKSQGFDLTKYAGKTVVRYVYEVQNADQTGPVYATLLVYQDQVIGGDVSSAAPDGVMHGFAKPSAAAATAAPSGTDQEQNTEDSAENTSTETDTQQSNTSDSTAEQKSDAGNAGNQTQSAASSSAAESDTSASESAPTGDKTGAAADSTQSAD